MPRREAEGGVLVDRLLLADRREEIDEMVVAARRSLGARRTFRASSCRTVVFGAGRVELQGLRQFLLHGIRERRDRVVSLEHVVAARLDDAGPVQGKLGEADVDHAVAADEAEERVAAAAVLEVALKREREAGMPSVSG